MKDRPGGLRFLDLILPPACLGCGGWMGAASTPPRYLCSGCAARIRTPPRPVCSRCGAPVTPEVAAAPDCAECRPWAPALRSAAFAALLEPPADDLVHALKYGGWPEAAREMARSLLPRLAATLASPLPDAGPAARVLLVPVPTTRDRMRRRGYNQAEMLALALASAGLASGSDSGSSPEAPPRSSPRSSGSHGPPSSPTPDPGGVPAIVVAPLLVRTRSSGSQVALHREERMANVHGAFSLDSRACSMVRPGDRLILVDDVLTTGATASAAALALEEGGLGAVDLLTYGRAFPDREEGLDAQLPGPGYFLKWIRSRPTPASGG